ncbi:uncharacterized protein LOC143878963 [Tasmannia lanceolata]|uniref:uncharacterized protein LOC143878963 n=1 Tax=Tasmannia lanceolata TaxID=3420 RepID=UPI004062E3D9
MTESGELPRSKPPEETRRRRCRIVVGITFLIVVILLVIVLILALTVFKSKDPTTTLLSASVQGVAPRVTLPAIRIELNITLDLKILVHNPNHASFKHGQGQSFVLYRTIQVGDLDIPPGRIPASGSENITTRLTVEAGNLISDVGQLISDVMAGEVGFDVRTRIPGRVTFLGIFRRHAVAFSECHVAIGFPSLSIRRQECRHHTKL